MNQEMKGVLAACGYNLEAFLVKEDPGFASDMEVSEAVSVYHRASGVEVFLLVHRKTEFLRGANRETCQYAAVFNDADDDPSFTYSLREAKETLLKKLQQGILHSVLT